MKDPICYKNLKNMTNWKFKTLHMQKNIFLYIGPVLHIVIQLPFGIFTFAISSQRDLPLHVYVISEYGMPDLNADILFLTLR